MQSLSWYFNRLKGMSNEEIIWRVKQLWNAQVDQMSVITGLIPKATFVAEYAEDSSFTPGFRVSQVPVGCWVDAGSSAQQAQWLERLRVEADELVAGKLSYFDLKNVDLGNPIDWHIDRASGKAAAVNHINFVNYRDFSKVGDCKLVWEPNRHHHLVILARAYRATGEMIYAQSVVDQINSWMEANPFGKGMNWRSPLELGVRLINWVWAIDLILESGLFSGDFRYRVIECVYLHCRDVAGKFSQGSSANNHLVGEAAGVFIAANYFSMFQQSAEWIEKSKAILETEISAQSYPDGCTREQALGYQFFVIQFYLFSGMVGQWRESDFSPDYWRMLVQLMTFVAQLAQGGRQLPMFGDRDDGYVLNLGESADDVNALMTIGAKLSDNPVFAQQISEVSETYFWLYGDCPEYPESVADKTEISSISFDASGYYLLQYGTSESCNKASVLFDCAELGYQSIAAHGHADALSFALRLNDIDCFVDTGTYDYFSYPQWRNYFRSTRAHNTVEIDDVDQSEMAGPFLWLQHAQARRKEWSPSEKGGIVSGEHTGYQRLDDPVTHNRSLVLDGEQRSLEISDQLEAAGSHKVAIYFHLSEFCKVKSIENNLCTIEYPAGEITLEVDEALTLESVTGSEQPVMGWLSRGYHQKTAVTTLIARGEISSDRVFNSKIVWS